MVVTAVGMNSQSGIIFALLGAAENENKAHAKATADEPDANTQGKAEQAADGHRKSTQEEDNPHKEKSVLQAKLTKLAIQIGYAGVYLFFFPLFPMPLVSLSRSLFVCSSPSWRSRSVG